MSLQPYAADVVARARKANMQLACAESCTGGGIAQAITSIGGSSRVFWGGYCVYANAAKSTALGIGEYVVRYGAVSSACALAMAGSMSRIAQGALALSVTGIAGPGGAVHGKPRGCVYFALAHGERACWQKRVFTGVSRSTIRYQASLFGLRLLRDALAQRLALHSSAPSCASPP